MKIADLKLLLPRIKYSKHTPKLKPYTEGYFMKHSPLKDTFIKKDDQLSNFTGIIRTNLSNKTIL